MILYIDQQQNHDPRIQRILQDHGCAEFLMQDIGLRRFNSSIPGLYNRHGKNTLPFKNGFQNKPGFAMPDYDPTFNKSWQQVMDERCAWLQKHRFDKRWVIGWSGGIDSTGILASIIKNMDRADFDNVIVACSKFSVWENPKFFFDFIEPNFQTIESKNLFNPEMLTEENYILDGEPADQLFAGMGAQSMMLIHDVSYLEKDAMTDSGPIIDYIAKTPGVKGSAPPGLVFAEWLYASLIENVKSTNIPIHTYHDLLWWYFFNFNWTAVKLRALSHNQYATLENAGIYFDRFIHWFDSDDYQSWAMHNNLLGAKYGSNVGQYKYQAKKYIFDLDKNSYYFKYKTKTFSGDAILRHQRKKWYCITDDLSLLNLEDHWHIIEKLLPEHIYRNN